MVSSSSSSSSQTDLAGGTDYIPQIPRPASSSSIGNLSPSILIIILILGLTLLASVSLCLLLRHLNRRDLSSVVSAANAASVSSRRVSPEIPADSLLESLPLFEFSALTRSSSSSAFAADCAVCLSKFEPEDQLRLLPLCRHAFHALCVDTWLRSSPTCPLCRSPVVASDADLLKAALGPARIDIGTVSRREAAAAAAAEPPDRTGSRRRSRSYSIGSSFEYLVEEDSEVALALAGVGAHRRAVSELKDDAALAPAPAVTMDSSLAADVASSGRSWLKDYVDRLSMSFSSRALSFRSSGRFFSGSSRRSDVVLGLDREWDLEANRAGEEISELFRWVSGV